MEGDYQLPGFLGVSFPTSHSCLRLPFALPSLVLERSLVPPTFILHPPSLGLPRSFLFTMREGPPTARPRFSAFQSTTQTRGRRRRART